MVDASQIRPAGLQRKIDRSPLMATETAGDMIGHYFPRSITILGIYYMPTVATGTAPSIIDVGVAQNGETIIKDYSLSHSGSAAGTAVEISAAGALLLRTLPPGTTVWYQTDGASTGGDGYFYLEYIDDSM